VANTLNNLWLSDIRPDVLSPFAILELQAQALGPITKGLLLGEVHVSYDAGKENTYVSLDLIAPALHNYRRRILTAAYRTDMIYPVRVDADCFRPKGILAFAQAAVEMMNTGVAERKKRENEAASDQEFRCLVERVLGSDQVKSLAVSLIAQSNDVLKARQKEAEKTAETGNGSAGGQGVTAGAEGKEISEKSE
jgi:hypothetical protein